MSSIYANFFTPQTISILFCIYELNKEEAGDIDPRHPLMRFLIDKILSITNKENIAKDNHTFEAEMLSITNDEPFLREYQLAVKEITSFNHFYRKLSKILKHLRGMRNSKLQQGNLVDFLIRRMYIYFEKLDFKEIVVIFDNFMAYCRGEPQTLKQHQFMLTKTIQEVKFNIENYPLGNQISEINKVIKQLEAEDHTFKTSYLKGLMKAEEGIPSESIHSVHRYFDKSLGNLFQEKIQSIGSSNKINHCILSIAYASLKMGHLDQCLQSISEGLRISQNNSDEQSINNCIIYLYKIAERLGKFREQILLAEHAITHSLNLNNLMLMLYSCLNYSYFEKNYNCKDSSITLLKSRQINWTDALHFAKKKIYSHFENNCKNIFHTHRSLLIPTFTHKIAILIHLPELSNLLLNPYYDRQQLTSLTIYKEYLNQDEVTQLLKKAKLYLFMGYSKLLEQCFCKLSLMKSKKEPKKYISIAQFEIEVMLQKGHLIECYQKTQSLIAYCYQNGYTKGELISQMMTVNKILLKNQLYFDALINCEEIDRICEKHALKHERIANLVNRSLILLKLNRINKPLKIMALIEESGDIILLNNQQLIHFYEVKIILSEKIQETLLENGDISEQKVIEENIMSCHKKILELSGEELNLRECMKWSQKMNTLGGRKIIEYGERVLKVAAEWEIETGEEQKLSKRVLKRILSWL